MPIAEDFDFVHRGYVEGRPAVYDRKRATWTYLDRAPGWIRRAWYWLTGRTWGYILIQHVEPIEGEVPTIGGD